jgi:hypothetical protein
LTQGEEFYVDLLVEEESVAFEGALVQFSTSDGVFTDSGTNTLATATNTLGEIRVMIDTSEMTVYTATGLDINISVIVTDEDYKFNPAEAWTISHANKYNGTLEGTVDLTPGIMNHGENASIKVSVTLDTVALENASVRITVTGGIFESSETEVVSGLTNAAGEITFTWISEGLPKIDMVQNIVFTVVVIYESNQITASATLVVNPVTIDDTTDDDDGNNVGVIIIAGVAGVAVIGTVTVVLVKKK